MIAWIYAIIVIVLVYSLLNQNGFSVFLFHKIDEKSDTTPEVFEEILRYLVKKKYHFFTAKEIEKCKKIPKKSIMITFDDGYKNNYEIVFPLLKKYQAKVTLFVNTEYILNSDKERKANIIHAEYPFLIWSEVKEMVASGLVDIQLHTGEHYFQFVPSEIKEVFKEEKNLQDLKNYHILYGRKNNLEGLPIFRKRGETSELGFKLYPEKLDELKKKLLCYSNLNHANKEINLEEYGYTETEKEFAERVEKIIKDNQKPIQNNLGYLASHFAWPWGHCTKLAIKVIKKLEINGLYTCVKGPNSRKIDHMYIRRDSFRKASLKSFKMKLYLCQNKVVGKVYEWLS